MSSSNIIPKDCSYGCNTRIYWDNSQSTYLEVFTKQRHICKNRTIKKDSGNLPQSNYTNTNRPFYNKKPWSNTPKPKLSNSFEYLQGPIDTIQKNYEILSSIVNEYLGVVFGSQSHVSPHNNELSIVVYFGVPEGRLSDFKQKFNNQIVYTRQQNNYR
jgi:hypothetical protein